MSSSSSSSSSSSTGTVCKRTTFTYDKAHNRVQRSVVENSATVQTDYSYNQLNQLTEWQEGTGTPVSYQYDNNGNRTLRTQGSSQTDYAYDFDNRLREVDADGVIYRYQYDYRTRRVGREENGTVTRVSYSGGNSVLEFDANDNLLAEFIRGSGMGGGIGSILYSVRPDGSGGEIASLTNYNHRGDVVSKTDDTGTVTYQAAYEAFGKHPDETGSTQDRQRANTKEEDPAGLLNEGMRYRDLETGEFITRDPAGFVDGPNLYTYVRQNPWSKFDPLGLEEEKDSKGLLSRIVSKIFNRDRSQGGDTGAASARGDHEEQQSIPALQGARFPVTLTEKGKGVDLNLTNTSDSLNSKGGLLWDDDQTLTVLTHGTHEIATDLRGTKGRNLSPKKFVELLKEEFGDDFGGNSAIMCYSCNFGRSEDGDTPAAQLVADESGLRVIAATDYTWVDESGHSAVFPAKEGYPSPALPGDEQITQKRSAEDEGRWIVFEPRNKSE